MLLVTNQEILYFKIPVLGTFSMGWFTSIVLIAWLVLSSFAFKLYEEVKGLSPAAMIIILAALSFIAFQTQQTLIAMITAIFIIAIIGTLQESVYKFDSVIGKAYASLLGLIIGFLALESGRMENVNVINAIVPISIMAVPMLEAILAIKRKYINGESLKGQYIHDRLTKLGFSHKNAILILLALIALSSIVGISVKYITDQGIVTLLFAVVLLMVMFIYRLGYIKLESNIILVDDDRMDNFEEDRYLSFDRKNFIQKLLFLGVDAVLIVGALLLTYFMEVRFGVPKEYLISSHDLLIWSIWSVIFWCGLLGLNDLYDVQWDTSRIEELIAIVKIIFFGALVIYGINFIIDVPVLVTRGYFLIYITLLFAMISVGRLFLISVLRKYGLLEFSDRPTIIIGTGNKAHNIYNQVKNIPILKFDILGFIADIEKQDNLVQEKIMGQIDDISEIIRKNDIKEAIIAVEDNNPDKILNIVAVVDDYNVSVKVIPEYYNLLTGFRTSYIHGISLAKFITTNMKTWEWIVKRFIDIILSLVVLILFLPIWLVIAIAIKIDSKGPILYSQIRSGKNKKEFKIYKFRSMVADAEKYNGAQWASKEDPRITKVGNFLRKSGLDEIPQFLNVLMGDMSIVGPRPERPVFIKKLEKQVKFYTRRLLVKPGITGWAQMKYKYDESIEDVKEKVKDDLYYIRNMSITLDLKIIVQTALTVFQKWKKHH